MDPVLNGKALLEKQIPALIMYTIPFSPSPTLPSSTLSCEAQHLGSTLLGAECY